MNIKKRSTSQAKLSRSPPGSVELSSSEAIQTEALGADPRQRRHGPGGQLVYFERGATSSDLWLLETRRGVVSRFPDDADENVFPLWTRDGDRIVYTTNRSGQSAIHQRHVGTGAAEELIPPQAEGIFASDVSPDGRYLVYQRMDAATGWDVWALPLDGSGESVPVVRTGADERGARLSPDGAWVAFVTNRDGTFEVYVQPFLGSGLPVRVSTLGGDQAERQAEPARNRRRAEECDLHVLRLPRRVGRPGRDDAGHRVMVPHLSASPGQRSRGRQRACAHHSAVRALRDDGTPAPSLRPRSRPPAP